MYIAYVNIYSAYQRYGKEETILHSFINRLTNQLTKLQSYKLTQLV